MSEQLADVREKLEGTFAAWINHIKEKDIARIVSRTTLQVGIHEYACLEYIRGRAAVADGALTSHSGVSKKRSEYAIEATKEQVEAELLPALRTYVQQQWEEAADTGLFNYHFTVECTLELYDGTHNFLLGEWVDEQKKARLQQALTSYWTDAIEQGQHPTKKLETFFLFQHLLSPRLYPSMDAGYIRSVAEKIILLNKGNKEQLAEHRRTIISALRNWVQEDMLPQYFSVNGSQWGEQEYVKKAELTLTEADEQAIALLQYTAVQILKYEPSFARNTGMSFIDCAVKLGSSNAARLLKEGSGSIPSQYMSYKSSYGQGRANDVLATIEIQIKQETEESYREALHFIIALLKQGFPKSYQIKCKSSAKHFLPIKGLAKSGTHRFFANAAQYAELHPLLEQYAYEAFEEFEWYADADDERCGMPGSYAVFALALQDQHYFKLLVDYMELVDEEHQLIHHYFVAAFIERYGVTTVVLPTLLQCLHKVSDSVKLKLKELFNAPEVLRQFVELTTDYDSYELEHAVYMIWGGTKKLSALLKKAEDEQKIWLEQIMERASQIEQ